MRNRKLTAVFLGTVFALGLIAGGYGAFGETVNAKAKKTEKGEYKEVQIGFPSAGSDWAEGTLALAQEKGYLDEYLHPLGYDAKLTAFTGAAPAIHEALVAYNGADDPDLPSNPWRQCGAEALFLSIGYLPERGLLFPGSDEGSGSRRLLAPVCNPWFSECGYLFAF